jgi:cytochrome c
LGQARRGSRAWRRARVRLAAHRYRAYDRAVERRAGGQRRRRARIATFTFSGDHMRKTFGAVLVLAGALWGAPTYSADSAGDAVALVDKGVAYLQKNGKDALIAEINKKNPSFLHGDIYLAVRSIDGTMLAHPINPRLVGKNMLVLPDADGKYFRKEIVELAKSKGKGWVDYRYNNPTTKDIEQKSTYLVRQGDVILEAGIYKGK